LSRARACQLAEGDQGEEVWGVGTRIAAKLDAMGIGTVEDLRRASPRLIRLRFSVVLERTVAKLQGISCLSLEEVAPAKKQIVSSKSFGQMVTMEETLGEALSTYVSRAAKKLCAQHGVVGALQVFAMMNAFRPDDPRYSNGIVVALPHPTNNTMALVEAALAGLHRICRPGFAYKKCGVMLMDLSPEHQGQQSLFASVEAIASHSDAVMSVLDSINASYGRDTLTVAAAGIRRHWQARAETKTLRYTACWEELPKAKGS
jgi:DNA polymerase V